MILLSVGTQLPFDRLTRTVDRWAEMRGRADVVGQIGVTRFAPVALQSFAHADYASFRELQQQCTLMVGHAGMGSIIAALEFGKPIIIMPRDHRLGEHRNGHQLATVERFGGRSGIYPARDEAELVALLDRAETLTAGPAPGTDAAESFARALSELIVAPARPPMARRLRQLLGRRARPHA